MGDFNLLRLALVRHVAVPGALGLIVAVVVACSNDAVPVDGQGAGAVTAAETGSAGESKNLDDARSAGEVGVSPTAEIPLTVAAEVPEFDADAFAEINPDPEIPVLEAGIDTRGGSSFYEETRIPRDAINPVYTPSFVSSDHATLRPEEIVMGLVINGDARAYPVGMMRIREMVNDEVGGTPVLVTW